MKNKLEYSKIKMLSERNFGLIFSVFFFIVGFWPILTDNTIKYWSIIIAILFVLISLISPKVLKPLNILWHKFSILISRIVSEIIIVLLFFLTIVPIGIIMRIFKKDLLKQKFDRSSKSYWINREEKMNSMKNQF